MKTVALAAGSMVALLVISVPVAFAGPYSASGASAAVGTLVTTNCLDRLNGHSYSCDINGSSAGEFSDTLVFSGGTLTGAVFQHALTCSCGTDGSFTHPLFAHSKTKWQCVGQSAGYAMSFEGTVGASGKISKVTAADSLSNTYVYSCTGP